MRRRDEVAEVYVGGYAKEPRKLSHAISAGGRLTGKK
jgi:hypothetical protein